jgi:undecaprenyl-diphosphatase
LTSSGSRTTVTRLQLGHAVALGLLHGPTELLPISSSGHTALVPWLARWPYTELSPELRKSFEVALHSGTAAALLLRSLSKDHPSHSSAEGAPPSAAQQGHQRRSQTASQLGFLAAALGPPAFCGYAFGGQVERHLGTPATIAAGLLAGSAAMSAAEVQAKNGCSGRRIASSSPRDGLALGIAQALALIPGVSRSGATFAAARARGFSRADADRLSWKVGLPVIWREKPPRELTLPLAAGAATAFASTLWSATALGSARRTRLIPTAIAYRCILALLAIRRMRDNAT